VEEDPAWASAVIMVSMMHRNLGDESESEASCRRALELAKQLDSARRYEIEGWCYAGKEETYGQAIQALDAMLALEPSLNVWDHVVARRLLLLERVDEAIERWEQLGRVSFLGWLARGGLASAYARQERFDDAYQLIREFLATFPDRSEDYAGLGDHWVRTGSVRASSTPPSRLSRRRRRSIRKHLELASGVFASPSSASSGVRLKPP
jgi:tetratricopeptide (TPR) repeat protein